MAALHELTQAGRLRGLRFEGASSGPDPARTFTATAAAEVVTDPGSPDRTVVGQGSGGSKSAAKTAAAADLLTALES